LPPPNAPSVHKFSSPTPPDTAPTSSLYLPGASLSSSPSSSPNYSSTTLSLLKKEALAYNLPSLLISLSANEAVGVAVSIIMAFLSGGEEKKK
jgi:hypothetical protein